MTGNAVLLILLWFSFTVGSLCFYFWLCNYDLLLILSCVSYVLILHTLWEIKFLLFFFAAFSCCVRIKILLCNFTLHCLSPLPFCSLCDHFHDHTWQTLCCELGLLGFFNALLFPCILSLYIHITVFDIFMLLTVLISFVFLEVYIITVYVKRLAVACNIRRLINPMYYYYYYHYLTKWLN